MVKVIETEIFLVLIRKFWNICYLVPMFSYRLLLLTLEICCTLNCLSEIMTIFLNYLLKVKVKVTEIRNWLKCVVFSHI